MKNEILYKNKKLIIILIAILATIAININLDISNEVVDKNIILKIITIINQSFKIDVIKSVFIFIGGYFLFSKTFFKKSNKKNERKICKIFLGILFSAFTVIGESYLKTNSWNLVFLNKIQIFKSLILMFGYYCFYIGLINYIFDQLVNKIEYKESKNKVFNFIFEKHSFIIPFLIILICWIPYIVIYYPGILMPDSSNQIKQFFGLEISKNSATDSVNLIDENVKITNHHPVLHTVLLGMCMKVGKLIGNDNFGVFLCSLIQILLLSIALSYIVNFMKKIKTNNILRVVTLIIFSLLPIFPMHALEITKDILFTAFLIFYMINIYFLVKKANIEKFSKKEIIKLLFISICICFTRNNGIYVILFSLPLLFVIDKKNRKNIITICITIILINKIFLSIIFPALRIPTNIKREMLSIPFQQTARYVKEHNSEVTEEEKNIIDRVLEYDTLAKRYNPVHADSVKNKFNKDASDEDLRNYFSVWGKQLLKHPTTYIQATLNNYYGYVYPECKITEFTTKYIVNNDTRLNGTKKFNYKYMSKYKGLRKIVKKILETIQKVPVISWITNIAFNVWAIILMIVYMCYTKKYRYIICMMPIVSIILVNFASPVNAYFRYAMPYIFSMPLILSIFLDIVKEKGKGKK